jgi:hypothetical protein
MFGPLEELTFPFDRMGDPSSVICFPALTGFNLANALVD